MLPASPMPLFLIGETTKYCRRTKEKMKIFKLEEKTTKYCRRNKEKVKIYTDPKRKEINVIG